MRGVIKRTAAGCLALAFAVTGPAGAEVTLSGGAGVGWGSANAESSQKVERWITDATRFCGAHDPRWRVDCLRDQYRDVIPRLPKSGPYAGVAEALAEAATELETIAKREADQTRAPARLSVRRGAVTRQSAGAVRATAPARQAAANRAASAVLDQLATRLLRSAPQGAARQFSALAKAAEGAKTLLRST